MDGGYGDTGREVGTDCWSRCCVLPVGIEIANRPLQVQYMTLLRVHVSGGNIKIYCSEEGFTELELCSTKTSLGKCL